MSINMSNSNRPTSYQLGRTNSSRFCSDITIDTTPPQLIQKSVIGSVVTPTSLEGNCPCCTKPTDRCEHSDGVQELKSESSLLGLLQGVSSDEAFQIKQVLAEGWIEKKGTGKDWFGTTTYKQRWVQLALTQIPGYTVDVPVLHVYWHDSLPKPSMSLNLEKTVVVAGQEGTKPVFNIIHVAGGAGTQKENIGPMGMVMQDAKSVAKAAAEEQKVTRTFSSTSLQDCQEWVRVISEAMMDYEKRKRDQKILNARPKSSASGALLPRSPTSARRRQLLQKNLSSTNITGLPPTTANTNNALCVPMNSNNTRRSGGNPLQPRTSNEFNPQVYDM